MIHVYERDNSLRLFTVGHPLIQIKCPSSFIYYYVKTVSRTSGDVEQGVYAYVCLCSVSKLGLLPMVVISVFQLLSDC
jgi:hypothetical protein